MKVRFKQADLEFLHAFTSHLAKSSEGGNRQMRRAIKSLANKLAPVTAAGIEAGVTGRDVQFKTKDISRLIGLLNAADSFLAQAAATLDPEKDKEKLDAVATQQAQMADVTNRLLNQIEHEERASA